MRKVAIAAVLFACAACQPETIETAASIGSMSPAGGDAFGASYATGILVFAFDLTALLPSDESAAATATFALDLFRPMDEFRWTFRPALKIGLGFWGWSGRVGTARDLAAGFRVMLGESNEIGLDYRRIDLWHTDVGGRNTRLHALELRHAIYF